tara:strand:- start:868 stop:1341 length:474 start_codon:yes stop_codon:yes gene_type:complete
MADFRKSFSAGINAAKVAEKNRDEIQTVFDEVNKQLEEVAGGTLSIDRKRYYVNNAIQDLAAIANFKQREVYEAVIAFNPKASGSAEKELANWKMSNDGYPCRIYIGSNHISCEDKKALEGAIQELLRDTAVGEKLYQLMSLPILPVEPDDEADNDS